MVGEVKLLESIGECGLITWYRVRVKVLTPVHVGSGEVALEDFDYVYDSKNNRIVPIDIVKIGEAALNQGLDLSDWDQVLTNLEDKNELYKFIDPNGVGYNADGTPWLPDQPVSSPKGQSKEGASPSIPKSLDDVLAQPAALQLRYLFFLAFNKWPPKDYDNLKIQRFLMKNASELWRRYIQAKSNQPAPAPVEPTPSGRSLGQPGESGLDLSKLDQYHLFIRDGLGRPYLPGSSIKGALRTIVAAFRDELNMYKDKDGKNKISRFNNMIYHWNRNRPQKHNPTADLGRLFVVRDVPLSLDQLGLFDVRVFSSGGSREERRSSRGEGRAGGTDIPLRVEAIRPGTELEFELGLSQVLMFHFEKHAEKLKKYAEKRGLDKNNPRDQRWLYEETGCSQARQFSPQNPKVANWWNLIWAMCQEGSVTSMLEIYNKRILDFILDQISRVKSATTDFDLSGTEEFIKNLKDGCPKPVIRLGFGSGWPSTTGIPAMEHSFGNLGCTDAQCVADKVGNQFGVPRLKGKYGTGNIHFPVSIKLAKWGSDWYPMGWMEVLGCE